VDWKLPAHVVDRQIRAWTPDPGAWTELDGVRVKLGPVSLDTGEQPAPAAGGREGSGDLPDIAPGELQVGRRAILVGTGTRPVRLGDVQAPGKRRMTAQDWARGLRSGGSQPAGGTVRFG
jgi:methionyl-tRNA formyltransferase